MTLSSKVPALTGPDRAVDALYREATFFRWLWLIMAVGIGVWACFNTVSNATGVFMLVLLAGSKIAHLFALLSAALAARGL